MPPSSTDGATGANRPPRRPSKPGLTILVSYVDGTVQVHVDPGMPRAVLRRRLEFYFLDDIKPTAKTKDAAGGLTLTFKSPAEAQRRGDPRAR